MSVITVVVYFNSSLVCTLHSLYVIVVIPGSTETQAIVDILLQVATKWVAIAVLLGIDYDTIMRFEAEDDLERRILKLAEAWLEKNLGVGQPTWRKLVEVIASKAGGDHQALAKRLATDHPVTEEQGKKAYQVAERKNLPQTKAL